MKVLDQKHLLKQAANGLIPKSIQKRHKQPYRAPDGQSFFPSTMNYVEEMLSSPRIKEDGIFNPVAVSALVAKFKSGRDTSTKDNMALVGILSTQLLTQQFIHQRPEPNSTHEQSAAAHREPAVNYDAEAVLCEFSK
jgi:asparagine synthase (glutamine-hydrolysing)